MLMSAKPAVSVVIPTHKRPHHVVRAVACALSQTMDNLEVIVVNDGADAVTAEALGRIDDPRLKVVALSPARGNAGARNAGIEQARGEWIALLDDDDHWKPEKLKRQLDFARDSRVPLPIISCAFEAVGNGARFVWPAQLPQPGQPISEYLFTRSGPKVAGAIQTSTLLVPKALFDRVRFGEDVDRYVDLDWLLRAASLDGVELLFAPGETLSVYSMDDARKRISNQADWQRDVEWIRERRELVTPRAYGGYLLTQASIRAEKSRDKSAFLPLVMEAVRRGRISLGELAFHVGNTFFPARLRRALTNQPAPNGAARSSERADSTGRGSEPE